jgi:hypothetical protein
MLVRGMGWGCYQGILQLAMDLNCFDYLVSPGFNQVRLTAKNYVNVADLAQKLDDPFRIIQFLRLTLNNRRKRVYKIMLYVNP